MDNVLGVVYGLHILWAAGVFIPKIGDAVAQKCFSNYHCSRYVRRSQFGHTVDLADGQWREFRSSLWLLMLTAVGTSLLVIMARNILSKQLRYEHQTVVRSISVIRVVIGVIILFVQHGYHAFIVIAIASVGYMLARLSYKGKIHFATTWLFAIIILLFKESYRVKHMPGFQFLIPLFDRRFGGMYGWQLPTNFLVLRIISYSLDLHWRHSELVKKQSEKDALAETMNNDPDTGLPLSDYSVLHYFAYILYAPLYMAGPVITFDNFMRCSNLQHTSIMHAADISSSKTITKTSTSMDANTSNNEKVTEISKAENIPFYALRFVLCLSLMEYLLHRFPFFAVASSGLINTLSPIQTAIVCYVLLKMMWLKFLLLWRFFRLWAMCEGIYPPENMTRCMSNTYSLELFWRGWHSSFNLWLVRYLYKPLGGKGNQLYSVWIIFVFVALWHDIEWKLIAWGLLNAMFYAVEVCVKKGVEYAGVHTLPAPVYELLCAMGGSVYIIILICVNLVGYAVGVGGVSAIVNKLVSPEGITMILGCFYFLVIAVLLMRLLKKKGYTKG